MVGKGEGAEEVKVEGLLYNVASVRGKVGPPQRARTAARIEDMCQCQLGV